MVTAITLGALPCKVSSPVAAVAHRLALPSSTTTTAAAPSVALIRVWALSGKVTRPVATVANRLSSPSPAALRLVLPDDVIQAHVHLIHCDFQVNQLSCRSESSNKSLV